MPWCYIETWNNFNQATEIEPSTDWDYWFNVMTRDHARRFKGSLPPDSVGVDNLGLLVPQHIHQARIAAEMKSGEAASIHSQIEQALEYFFNRDHINAISMADQAAGITPYPLTVESVGATSITISWEPAAHANSYRIYYSSDRSVFEPCSFVKPDFIEVGNVTEFEITYEWISANFESGQDYYFAITAVDTHLGSYANESWYENTITGATIIKYTAFAPSPVPEEDDHFPKEFSLSQNYPNPFNPVTTIEYTLPEPQHVTLKIYNLQGREMITLVDEQQEIGRYQVELDARELSTGVYFYQLETPEFIQIEKMLLVK